MTPDQLLRAAQKAKSPDTRRKFMARYKHQVKVERLAARIERCANCARAQGTKRAKGWSGPTKTNLAILGDSRASFKAKDGATLDLALNSVGLERDLICLMHEVCKKHQTEMFELVNPLIVVRMGYQPILRPEFRNGRFFYDMRPPSHYRRRNDLGGLVNALLPVADAIQGWAELPLEEIPNMVDASISHAIEHQGWVKVYSAVIGDTLVATNQEPSMLPPETSKYPIYTLDELARIRVLADQKVMDTRMLRATHEIKKAFGRSMVTI